jgi:CRP-like cAMP-binding protein
MLQAKISLAEALKKVPLFNDLEEEERRLLGERALRHHFTSDGLVFSEGEPCMGLYIVETGRVKLFKSSTSGREQTLAIQGPGSTVGELAALDGGNYPVSAKACPDADLLLIRREDLQGLCLRHPKVGVKLLEVIASRVRPMISIIEQLSFSTVRQRLAGLLLRLAAQEGKRTDQGVKFRLTSTNRDLAAQIGTVPELVSRNLGSLEAAGLIKIRGKTIIIANPQAIQLEAEHPY